MRKVLASVLAIWLVIGFVISVYYEFKLKAICIKEDGLLKGLFWCTQQPKTSSGYTAMQTNLLLRGLAWPYVLLSDSNRPANKDTSGTWGLMEKGTPYTVATAIPISKEENFKAILLVFFNPRSSCAPELSFLAMANDKLGDPEGRDPTPTSMLIAVDGGASKNYPTVFNQYTSGIEHVMRLDDGLLVEMGKSRHIVISPSNTRKDWDFPLDGFQAIAAAQYAACKASK